MYGCHANKKLYLSTNNLLYIIQNLSSKRINVEENLPGNKVDEKVVTSKIVTCGRWTKLTYSKDRVKTQEAQPLVILGAAPLSLMILMSKFNHFLFLLSGFPCS